MERLSKDYPQLPYPMPTTTDLLPVPHCSTSWSRAAPTVAAGIPQLLQAPWKWFSPPFFHILSPDLGPAHCQV